MTRRVVTVWLGCAALAAGLAMAGLVAWELVGTSIVSQRRHAQLVEEVTARWDDPRSSEESGSAARRVSPGPGGGATALVRIPRFGQSYVMPVVEGTDDGALARGLGHEISSAGPGQRGNFVLAGHRVTHGEPLGRMPSLRRGDVLHVETRDAVYSYVLDTDAGSLVVDDADAWVLDARPTNPDPTGPEPSPRPQLITLVTCAARFHTDERMVVFGHLQRTRAK